MMNYVTLEYLNELLKSVPKAIIITMFHEHVKWKSPQEIEIMVLDKKQLLNLQQQEEVLNKTRLTIEEKKNDLTKDSWGQIYPKLGFLNDKFKKLDKEYDILDKQRDELVNGKTNE